MPEETNPIITQFVNQDVANASKDFATDMTGRVASIIAGKREDVAKEIMGAENYSKPDTKTTEKATEGEDTKVADEDKTGDAE